ncbi:MAG: LPS assembly protein LptD [Proteobacteria bacterium]|nr:LPS assembly protein LptD [Pseudomonadota bacterium]
MILIFSVLALGPAHGADQAEMTVSGDPAWTMKADRIFEDREADVFIAEGRVKIVREGEVIEADRVRFHQKDRTGEARGNVVIASPDFKIVCRRFIFNLEHAIGKFYDGKAYFPDNHYYLRGDEIEKTGPDTLFVMKGEITTCDGPAPAWMLTGHNIEIQREGYATLTHVTLSTRHFPVLYMPWLKIPVKQKRQSGLLIPEILSSNRDGMTLSMPYYWAISDSKDMTIYLTHMAYRGLESCVEFRYKDWGGKGIYRATYLKDEEPPTIEYDDPFGPRVEHDRFWLRGMSDMTTQSGFDIKLDLDYVSDPEYLDEFDRGFTGFQRTQTVLFNEFGRELAERLDPMRKSTLLATRDIGNQTMNFAVELTDDLNDPENRETLQRVPRIDLIYQRTPIGGSPLYFQNDSSYTYFTRNTLDMGHRLDVHPRVYWPLRTGGWLDLEPSFGFRETLYYPLGTGDPGQDSQVNTRELLDAQIDASTSFSRVYDLGFGSVEKLKHRIKPMITASVISDRSQDNLPYFDQVDRLAEQQQLRYGIVNYLTAKVRREERFPRPAVEETGAKKQEQYDYYDFLRFAVFRVYDFVEARRSLEARPVNYPLDFHRPNQPWEIEFELIVSPYFRFQTTSQFDTYSDSFTDHSMELHVQNQRGDFFFMEYNLNLEPYTVVDKDVLEYEQIQFFLNLNVVEDWSFQIRRRYSLMDEDDIETFYSVQFNPQCWGLRLEYMDKPNDRYVALIWSLLGIGDIGTFSYTPGTPFFREQKDRIETEPTTTVSPTT